MVRADGDPEGPLVHVAVDEHGALIVATADATLATTDAATVVTSLAAAWGVDLVLDSEQVMFATDVGATEARVEVAAADAAIVAAADDARADRTGDAADSTVVYVVGGAVPIDPARRLEIAAQLESSVTIASVEDVHLVVPHGAMRDYWPPAQRPVVAVRRNAGALVVEIFSTAGLQTSGPVRERIAMRALPDVRCHWYTGWVPVLAGEGEIAAVQRLLTRGTVTRGVFFGPARSETSVSAAEHEIETALGELGSSGAVIDDVLDRSGDPDLVAAVVSALHLPSVVGLLVEGSTRVDGLPGSQRIERTGLGRMVWEQTIAPAPGSSLWARWRRMPHSRPRLAAAFTVVEAVATVVVVGFLVTAPPPGPWDVVLWIVASVLAIDVVSDIVLLVALWRRRRRFT